MAKVIGVTSGKGGVGKTTTSTAVASSIAYIKPKAKVLLIEADSQGSIKQTFRLKEKETNGPEYPTFAGFLIDSQPISSKTVHKVKITDDISIDVLMASGRLKDADFKMVSYPRREETLRMRFESIKDEWDYIVIDSAPTLNIVTENILHFADHLIIPATMDPFATIGIKGIYDLIKVIENHWQRSVNVAGILPTIYDSRINMMKDMFKTVKQTFPKTKVFEPIGVDTTIRSAQLKGRSILYYLDNSRAAKQYLDFTKNLLEVIESKKSFKKTTQAMKNEEASL